MTEGRINVHLGELKEKLKALHPWGEVSGIVRVLIGSYVEGRIMAIRPEVSKLFDEGKDQEAIEILTADLIALRQRRLQAGQKAASSRSKGKSKAAIQKAGIKTPARQKADSLVDDMLKMQEDTNVIELSLEGGEDGLEGPSTNEDGDVTSKPDTASTKEGTAKKVS